MAAVNIRLEESVFRIHNFVFTTMNSRWIITSEFINIKIVIWTIFVRLRQLKIVADSRNVGILPQQIIAFWSFFRNKQVKKAINNSFIKRISDCNFNSSFLKIIYEESLWGTWHFGTFLTWKGHLFCLLDGKIGPKSLAITTSSSSKSNKGCSSGPE